MYLVIPAQILNSYTFFSHNILKLICAKNDHPQVNKTDITYISKMPNYKFDCK